MSQDLPRLNGLEFFPFHSLVLGTRDFGSDLAQFVRRHDDLVPNAREVLAALEEANAFSARLHARAWVWREVSEILEGSVQAKTLRFAGFDDQDRGSVHVPPAAHLTALATAYSDYPSLMITMIDSVEPSTLLRWRQAASEALHHLETAGLVCT